MRFVLGLLLLVRDQGVDLLDSGFQEFGLVLERGRGGEVHVGRRKN